jgi:DNA-binding SARP family transcriptional activator/pimeloyl-ACP methyl ester carboxylesterase
VRYLVLGPLDVHDGAGQRIRIDSPARRRLLAALAINASRPLSPDWLADVLWPDRLPADPVGALQTQVYRLRGELGRIDPDGDEAIVTTPAGYALRASPDDVDSLRFERLVAEAKTLAEAEPEAALARLGDALALWRGSPLAEFVDHEFALVEATRLEELHRSAREDRADVLVRLGRAGEAVPDLDELFTEAPAREGVCALLMTALYRSGRHAEALARYQTHRRFLGEELGLDPSPTLRALEEAILRHQLDGADARPSAPTPRYAFELRTAYVTLGSGASLAWASTGEGHPIVAVPAWVSNLQDIAAGHELRSALVATLARRHRVILYDRAGTGLSGGELADASVDRGALELIELLDRLDLGPVPLLACSQAGPVALAAAAERPDLVSHLLLLGTYASGPASFPNREMTEAMLALVRAHWGIASKALADMLLPDASTADLDRLAAAQRRAADANTALELLRSVYDTDVTDLLSRIEIPALVIHYSDDRAIPFLGARQLAAGLASAELVALPGRHHLPPPEDLERVTAAIDEFVERPR